MTEGTQGVALSDGAQIASVALQNGVDRVHQLEEILLKSHIVQVLEKDPRQRLVRPHLQLSEIMREQNFITSTLAGPGRLEVLPFTWVLLDRESLTSEVTMILYVGSRVSGHPGIIHGGFLASLVDEVLVRCAFPLLPSSVGVTARLEIDYKSPALVHQFLLLKSRTTRVQGRKVWAEASILSMGDLEETNGDLNLLVKAQGLFVEPVKSSVCQSSLK